MDLFDQISNDIKEAMKAKDKVLLICKKQKISWIF